MNGSYSTPQAAASQITLQVNLPRARKVRGRTGHIMVNPIQIWAFVHENLNGSDYTGSDYTTADVACHGLDLGSWRWASDEHPTCRKCIAALNEVVGPIGIVLPPGKTANLE